MPDDRRIDYRRDLTEEGFRLAEPLIRRMTELEADWVSTGDEATYESWRAAVTELQAVVRRHYVGDGPIGGDGSHGAASS